jgi:hypothetical protein
LVGPGATTTFVITLLICTFTDSIIVDLHQKFILLRQNCQKYHCKFLNLYWRNSRWKLNPKSKNKQTDSSCTKCVFGLCYMFYYFNTTWLICSFFKGKQSTC